jgi:diguanylate cyclase (GGDEF)-like protein/PAS domain S-box-containing protein
MPESAYQLAATLSALVDAVIAIDGGCRITRLNFAAEMLTGWKRAEAVGRPLAEVFTLDGEVCANPATNLPQQLQGATQPFALPPHCRLVARNGSHYSISGSVVPLPGHDASLTAAIIVFRAHDSTPNSEVLGREQLLSTVLNTLPITILLKDAEGRYLFVNDEFCRRLHKSREELLGKTLFEVFPDNFARALDKLDRKTLAEKRHITREGPSASPVLPGYWVTGTTPVDLGPDSEPVLMRYALDITDRHEAEEQVRAGNKMLEVFFSQSLEGIFVTMLDAPLQWDDSVDKEQTLDHVLDRLCITKVNDALLGQYGITREQALGMTVKGIFAHDPEYGRRVMRQILDAGRLRLEVDERRLDGSQLWIEGDFIVLRDDDGLVAGVFGAQRDINERKKAQLLLVASAERFRATFEQAAVGIGHLDCDGKWLRVNDRLCQIAGRGADELHELTVMDLFHPEDRPKANADLHRLLARRIGALSLEQRVLRPSGSIVWAALTLSVVRAVPGEHLHAVAVVEDVTERKHAEALLRASEQRFRDVVGAAGEFVWETDADWRITFISQQMKVVTGYTPEEVIGRHTYDFVPQEDALSTMEWFARRLAGEPVPKFFEHRLITKWGKTSWVQVSGVPVRNEAGAVVGYRGTSLDVTDRRLAQQQIEQLATKDSLTGLPNRLLLHDRLEQGIAGALRKGEQLALMFIDLDRFKTINDSLGHHTGDLLLQAVAGRLSYCVRKGDTLARLGGDEFIVALYELADAEHVMQIAEKILVAVSEPLEIGGHLLSTGCSIGISLFPSDGADVATLMRNADTAMYHAKEKGRNNYQFFSPEMNVRAVERLHLENELRLAVQQGQFSLHYQPQVCIASGEIVGVEALVRWIHPRTGIEVSPNRFIHVAEETGLIVPLGEWVLRTACAQAKAWHDAGQTRLRVTVNVSVGQFRGPRSLVDTIARVLQETGLPARSLELEMTESLIFHNIEENVRLLAALGEMGTRIAIDDFGTGYSSLSYLKQLPVDTIKIDSSFIRDIFTDPSDAAIVAAIIAMARRLKLRVIAEGVETREQLAALADLQCDEYQGFYFSRPLAAEQLTAMFFSAALRRQAL